MMELFARPYPIYRMIECGFYQASMDPEWQDSPIQDGYVKLFLDEQFKILLSQEIDESTYQQDLDEEVMHQFEKMIACLNQGGVDIAKIVSIELVSVSGLIRIVLAA